MKTYIRFSKPGGRGFIPGTSKDKFRHDWINVISYSFLAGSNQTGYALGGMSGTAKIASDQFKNIAVVKETDNASVPIAHRLNDGSATDIVALEGYSDDGQFGFRAELYDVLVGSVQYGENARDKVSEEITLTANSAKVVYLRGGHQLPS